MPPPAIGCDMVVLSLWVGISLLPRLNARGRGCWGRAGRGGGLRCLRLPRSPLPYLFSQPAARTQGSPRPGSRNHAAPPTARGRRRLYSRPDPARLPAAVPPTSLAPKAHIPGEGGRNHRANSRSLDARLNHSYGGQGKGGERMGDATHLVQYAERGSFVEAVSEGMAGFWELQFCEKPSPSREKGRGQMLRVSPQLPNLVAPAVSRLGIRAAFLSGFLGFGVPGGFWDLRFPACGAPCVWSAPRPR